MGINEGTFARIDDPKRLHAAHCYGQAFDTGLALSLIHCWDIQYTCPVDHLFALSCHIVEWRIALPTLPSCMLG